MRLQEFPGALYSAEIMGDERKEGGGANDTGNEGPLAPKKESAAQPAPSPPPAPIPSAACRETVALESPDTQPFSSCCRGGSGCLEREGRSPKAPHHSHTHTQEWSGQGPTRGRPCLEYSVGPLYHMGPVRWEPLFAAFYQ